MSVIALATSTGTDIDYLKQVDLRPEEFSISAIQGSPNGLRVRKKPKVSDDTVLTVQILKDLFKGHLDLQAVEWIKRGIKCDKRATKFLPFELSISGCFRDIFATLDPKKLGKLCIGLDQIVSFAETEFPWLRRNRGVMFFLTEMSEQVHVVKINVRPNGSAHLWVFDLNDTHVWKPDCGYIFMFPHLRF